MDKILFNLMVNVTNASAKIVEAQNITSPATKPKPAKPVTYPAQVVQGPPATLPVNTIIMIAVAATLALGVGILVGYFLGKRIGVMSGVPAVIRNALRGEVLGLIYNITDGSWDLVGLVPTGKNVYYSTSPKKPLIMLKPSSVSPGRFLGKPVLMGFAIKPFAVASNPEYIMKIGLASLTLGKEFETTTADPISAIKETAMQLAKKGAEYRGSLPINPELEIGIALRIPDVVKSIKALMIDVSSSTMLGIRDAVENIEKFNKYVLEYLRAKTTGAQVWSKVLIWIGMIILIIVVTWLILMRG